jgi:endonuclease/exonuclease/phosphatase family metal-dependent hydrolase
MSRFARAVRFLPRVIVAACLVLASGAGAGGAAASVPAAAAEDGSGPVIVMTFNMCGEHCNADSTGSDIRSLIHKINAYQPNVVFLEEVCGAQFSEIEGSSQLAENWSLEGFMGASELGGCDGGNDEFGDAVLVHGEIVEYARLALKYPYGKGAHRQTREVVCGRVDDGLPRLAEVCTLHAGLDFEIGKKHQARQIKQAYQFARSQNPSDPLIFGGDFNVVPSANALDVVYAKGGDGAKGAMEEVDACPGKHGRKHHKKSCNRKTHDPTRAVKHRTKNDYIFLSHKSFNAESAEIVKSKYSDHDMLIGHAFLCSSGTC